jgi:DNA polymerase (family 10)
MPVATQNSRAAAALRLTNADIAQRLLSLAQLLAARGDNPFKVRAYRRAADMIKTLPESIDDLVRSGADLTSLAGVGKAIAGALQEIVLSGTLGQLETLRAEAGPEVAAISEHPRLDPKRVLRAYKKLGIGTIAALQEKLASGEVAAQLGSRMAQHFQSAFIDRREMLLVDADDLVPTISRFLERDCGAGRVEVAGEFRRRVEVVGELTFVVATNDFAALTAKFQTYGGGAEPVANEETHASFRLSSGTLVTLRHAVARHWGVVLLQATGTEAHVEKLEARERTLRQLVRGRQPLSTERAVYRACGLRYIPPELREGRDEIEQAASGRLPALVSVADIRGELHAHTTSSDGAHTIPQMVEGARARGYAYLGITDHSQSLKIAGGLSEDALWQQIRVIDRLNARLRGFRVLKSAEVDIHVDGRLDYPDELLRELDYTVCSIHSRFGLGREQQTDRLLRAMDNPHCGIIGHATGRLLLRRPGYEIDVERVLAHAKAAGCCFEINASPDRLDLPAENARRAREVGVPIAICTDAHSVPEFDYIRCGVDQARRAGLEPADILNAQPWSRIERRFAARRK